MRHLAALLPAILLGSPASASEPPPLGCADRGIWSDLDAEVRIALPTSLGRESVSALVDERHGVLVLYAAGRPVKAYPLGGSADLALGERGDTRVKVRPADAAELAPLLRGRPARRLAAGEKAPPGDRDDDGLPDPLDILVGTKKLIVNGAEYEATDGYFTLSYPGGDMPRDSGVCTDTVIRALRNAGIDLQVELQRDLKAAPRAYPMVKRKGDPSIDHRRVRTLVPWFQRKWETRGVDPRAADDPFLPGDVVFFDTLSRPGPDHVGIVSDTIGENGLPLVVNNWTAGYRDSEMDLLPWVPVTHRFRARPEPAPAPAGRARGRTAR